MNPDSNSTSDLQEALLDGELIEEIKKILLIKYDAKVSSSYEIDVCKEIVDICINKKINVLLPETKYSTLLHFVARYLDSETFRSVLTKTTDYNINAKCQNYAFLYDQGGTLLHFVVDQRKINLVKDLLEFGADVNARDFNQQTPLFHAVRSVQNEIVEILLKAGCDVNIKDDREKVAINYLFDGAEDRCFPGDDKKLPYLETMQLFCAHGVNLDFNNKNGTNMLYQACEMGLLEEVTFLLKYRADLFFTNCNEETLLHAAVRGINFDLIDFLISNGLNINATNEENQTPLSLLANFSVDSYYYIPRNKKEKMKQDADMIEFLADNGANINGVHKDGFTAFEQSIFSHAPEIMECLLELNGYNFYSQRCCDFFENLYEHWLYFKRRHIVLELLIAFVATKKDYCDISRYNLEKFEWVMPFFKKCKLEVNRMKVTNICENSNVSYLDLFFKNIMEIAFLCRNEQIILALKSEEYKEKFPSYKFFLEKRIMRAQVLKKYMDALTRFFNKLFKNNLPSVVVDIILSFLSPGDIRNFGRAAYVPSIC